MTQVLHMPKIKIRWKEFELSSGHRRRTDGRTDIWTNWTIHRAAWLQLKTNEMHMFKYYKKMFEYTMVHSRGTTITDRDWQIRLQQYLEGIWTTFKVFHETFAPRSLHPECATFDGQSEERSGHTKGTRQTPPKQWWPPITQTITSLTDAYWLCLKRNS